MSDDGQVRFRRMSMECQMNVKSQSELDIVGRETCSNLESYPVHNQIHGLVPIELYALVLSKCEM